MGFDGESPTGNAPVHIDLAAAADGSELSFVGHSVLDAALLCAALAP